MSAGSNRCAQLSGLVAGCAVEKNNQGQKDINIAEKSLNTDHYSLEKVKDRILEYLAVQQRANKLKGPILCLVGYPGVGKTSLGQSIAKTTNRNFVRISLGACVMKTKFVDTITYIRSNAGKLSKA